MLEIHDKWNDCLVTVATTAIMNVLELNSDELREAFRQCMLDLVVLGSSCKNEESFSDVIEKSKNLGEIIASAADITQFDMETRIQKTIELMKIVSEIVEYAKTPCTDGAIREICAKYDVKDVWTGNSYISSKISDFVEEECKKLGKTTEEKISTLRELQEYLDRKLFGKRTAIASLMYMEFRSMLDWYTILYPKMATSDRAIFENILNMDDAHPAIECLKKTVGSGEDIDMGISVTDFEETMTKIFRSVTKHFREIESRRQKS